jgi:hypothetical protein
LGPGRGDEVSREQPSEPIRMTFAMPGTSRTWAVMYPPAAVKIG